MWIFCNWQEHVSYDILHNLFLKRNFPSFSTIKGDTLNVNTIVYTDFSALAIEF